MQGDAWLSEVETTPLAVTSDVRHVVLRLLGGDQIEVGSVSGREAALELARTTAAAVDAAAEIGTWPEFGDRFVRPSAIVSVDVRRAS
jgi:hypothetical protein